MEKQKMAFLNIFSNKPSKEKIKEKIKIIIDYREKNCLIASELASMGFEIEFRELKVADYIVKEVAIERKTINDFISSMINRRLIKQLEEIQQYEKKLLVIEGLEDKDLYNDSKDWKGMNPNAIRGFLLSILLKYKVPIIFTKNYKDTAKFISILANKKEKEISLNVTKKTLNKKEQAEFILEGFPGVGPKTSKKLLKKFKTLRNVFTSSEEELTKILGKKAKKFKELIYNEY